ncbi:MAG: alpha-amylase family glycosyl hydrolase [Spirochaetota bacterium]
MQYYPPWLNQAVFYQVYPPSYYDSNADGIGDIPGLIQKLDYIKQLGCNAIWLNPVFCSSFRDGGYDITDYYTVAPRYGTNKDLRRLFREAEHRGIKVCLDLVPGHTSVDHPWFKHSSRQKKNRYTNWYIWTGSVWDNDPAGLNTVKGYAQRDGNYITNFFYSQPALNYGFARPSEPWQLPTSHPEVKCVRKEMENIIRFYLDMGARGLRVDMAFSLVKNDPGAHHTCLFWQEVRAMLDRDYPRAAFLSEWGIPPRALKGGFHADFLLHFHSRGYTSLFRKEYPWHADVGQPGPSFFSQEGRGNIREFLEEFMEFRNQTHPRMLMVMPSGSHDVFRIRRGRTSREVELVFAFIFTMPVIPGIYYGDEIGMRYLSELPSREGGYNRTGTRTPMQWDSSPNAGFSECSSENLYLPVDPDPHRPSVAEMEKDPSSLLNRVKKLVKLRREHPALQADSEFVPLYAEPYRYPLVYLRNTSGSQVLVCINPSAQPQEACFETPSKAAIRDVNAFWPAAGGGIKLSRKGRKVQVQASSLSYAVLVIKNYNI